MCAAGIQNVGTDQALIAVLKNIFDNRNANYVDQGTGRLKGIMISVRYAIVAARLVEQLSIIHTAREVIHFVSSIREESTTRQDDLVWITKIYLKNMAVVKSEKLL
jgi:hypothetical protein